MKVSQRCDPDLALRRRAFRADQRADRIVIDRACDGVGWHLRSVRHRPQCHRNQSKRSPPRHASPRNPLRRDLFPPHGAPPPIIARSAGCRHGCRASEPDGIRSTSTSRCMAGSVRSVTIDTDGSLLTERSRGGARRGDDTGAAPNRTAATACRRSGISSDSWSTRRAHTTNRLTSARMPAEVADWWGSLR